MLDGVLHYKGQPVPFVTIQEALVSFMDFLSTFPQSPILIGHNIKSFDVPVLHHHLRIHSCLGEFKRHMSAFSDTLVIAKKKLPDEQSYQLQELVRVHLGKDYEAHNALADVQILKEFTETKLGRPNVENLFHMDSITLSLSLAPLVDDKALSSVMKNKMVLSGLGLSHLKLAHSRDPANGIKALLSEPSADSKPRITKRHAIIAKVNEYVAKISAEG